MVGMAFWMVALGLAQAEKMVGVDWVPAGRADLVAALDGQTSGTGLSEFDGVLRPPLTAWAGWQQGQTSWLWGLAVGWERTATRIADSTTISSRGALRPSLDVRRALHEDGSCTQVCPWLQAGIYGSAPWARETSTLYTTEEQEAMATVASADRGRIAGYGLRLGGGAEAEVTTGLRIGVRWVTVVHQGIVNSEDGVVVATRLFPEAAITMSWRL